VQRLKCNVRYPGRDLNPDLPGNGGALRISPLCAVVLPFVKRSYENFFHKISL
jgi:hypothetical protein